MDIQSSGGSVATPSAPRANPPVENQGPTKDDPIAPQQNASPAVAKGGSVSGDEAEKISPSASNAAASSNRSVTKTKVAVEETPPSGGNRGEKDVSWTERTVLIAQDELLKAKVHAAKKKKKESAANYAFRVLRTIVGPSLPYDKLRQSLKVYKYDVGKALRDLMGTRVGESTIGASLPFSESGVAEEEVDKLAVKRQGACPPGQKPKSDQQKGGAPQKSKVTSPFAGAKEVGGSDPVATEASEPTAPAGDQSFGSQSRPCSADKIGRKSHQGASDISPETGKCPSTKGMAESICDGGFSTKAVLADTETEMERERGSVKQVNGREDGVENCNGTVNASITEEPHCRIDGPLSESNSAVASQPSSSSGAPQQSSAMLPDHSIGNGESETAASRAVSTILQLDSQTAKLVTTSLESGQTGTIDKTALGRINGNNEGQFHESPSLHRSEEKSHPSSIQGPPRKVSLAAQEKTQSKEPSQAGGGKESVGGGRPDDTRLGALISKRGQDGKSPGKQATESSSGNVVIAVQAPAVIAGKAVPLKKKRQCTNAEDSETTKAENPSCFRGGSESTGNSAIATNSSTISGVGIIRREDVVEGPSQTQSSPSKAPATSVMSACRKEDSTSTVTSQNHSSKEKGADSHTQTPPSLDDRNAAAMKYFSSFPSGAPLPGPHSPTLADLSDAGSGLVEEKFQEEVLRRARAECVAIIRKQCPKSRSDGLVGVLEFGNSLVCHICNKQQNNCAVLACGISTHVYCDNHCTAQLGFSARDAWGANLPVALDYCPVCSLVCPCSKCRRKFDTVSRSFKELCITRGCEDDPNKCEMDILPFATGQTRLPPRRLVTTAPNCGDNIALSNSESLAAPTDPSVTPDRRSINTSAAQAPKSRKRKEVRKPRSEQKDGRSRKKLRTQKATAKGNRQRKSASSITDQFALGAHAKEKAKAPRDAETFVILRCKELMSAKKQNPEVEGDDALAPKKARIDSGQATCAATGAVKDPPTENGDRQHIQTASDAEIQSKIKSLMVERDVARADAGKNLAIVEKLRAEKVELIDMRKDRDSAMADINRLRLKDSELTDENSKLVACGRDLRKERNLARADVERYLAIIERLKAENMTLIDTRKERDKVKADLSRVRLEGSKLTAENTKLAASARDLRTERDGALQQHNTVAELAANRATELKVAKTSIHQLEEEKEVLKVRLREVSNIGVEGKKTMLLLEKEAALLEVERLKKMVKEFQQYLNRNGPLVSGSNSAQAKAASSGSQHDCSTWPCKKHVGRQKETGENENLSNAEVCDHAEKVSVASEIDNTHGGKRPMSRESSSASHCLRSPIWKKVGPTEAENQGDNNLKRIRPTSVAALSPESQDPRLAQSGGVPQNTTRLQHWQFQISTTATAHGQLPGFVQGLDAPAQLRQLDRSRQLVATEEMPVHTRMQDANVRDLYTEVSRLQAENNHLRKRVAVTCTQEHVPAGANSEERKVSQLPGSEKPHIRG